MQMQMQVDLEKKQLVLDLHRVAWTLLFAFLSIIWHSVNLAQAANVPTQPSPSSPDTDTTSVSLTISFA